MEWYPYRYAAAEGSGSDLLPSHDPFVTRSPGHIRDTMGSLDL